MILEYGLFSKFEDLAVTDTFKPVKGYTARTRHYNLFRVVYGQKIGGPAGSTSVKKIILRQRTDDPIVAGLLKRRKRVPEYIPMAVQIDYERKIKQIQKPGRWFTTSKTVRVSTGSSSNIERGFRMVRLDKLYRSQSQTGIIEEKKRTYGVAGRHFIFKSRQATLTKVQNDLNRVITRATDYYQRGAGSKNIKELRKIYDGDTTIDKTEFQRLIRQKISDNVSKRI
jgi:hypothetical protein